MTPVSRWRQNPRRAKILNLSRGAGTRALRTDLFHMHAVTLRRLESMPRMAAAPFACSPCFAEMARQGGDRLRAAHRTPAVLDPLPAGN
jgi:hypothetical protein